jgi:hypothetical protein
MLYADVADRWCVVSSHFGDLECSAPDRVLTVRLESAADEFHSLANFLGVSSKGVKFLMEPVNARVEWYRSKMSVELQEIRRQAGRHAHRLLEVGRRFGYDETSLKVTSY